jgi:restriction endonuclease
MLASVVAGYLDSVEEREFDVPFMALLRAMGFSDVHFLHGAQEFGKDFIAKREIDGVLRQYAFQSKAKQISLGEWGNIRGQLDILRTNTLGHPNFAPDMPRTVALVCTKRLTGQARIEAQNYNKYLQGRSETPVALWDQDTLVEFFLGVPDITLATQPSAEFLEILGVVDQSRASDRQLERYSRNWLGGIVTPWRAVLEGAILANHLRERERLDLACFVGLGLIRAAWSGGHGAEPPSASVIEWANLGRLIFVQNALKLWQRCNDEMLDPTALIQRHDHITAFFTYPVRCLTTAEILSLLALSGAEAVQGDLNRLSEFVHRFVVNQPGAAHPVSDRFAVSLVPVGTLLLRNGHKETLVAWVREVTKWVADRYERGLGLAAESAPPDEVVLRLVGRALEHVPFERRTDSFVASALLDLTALSGVGDLFDLVRNEFLAVKATPRVLTVPDTGAQYVTNAAELRLESNAPYEEHWKPLDGWKVAPHHSDEPAARYLDRIGRSWDLLAIASVLRDRLFITAVRTLLRSDAVSASA